MCIGVDPPVHLHAVRVGMPGLEPQSAARLKSFFSRQQIMDPVIDMPPESMTTLEMNILDIDCVRFGLTPLMSLFEAPVLPNTLAFDYLHHGTVDQAMFWLALTHLGNPTFERQTSPVPRVYWLPDEEFGWVLGRCDRDVESFLRS
jgi:hypothetical protein